MTMTMYEALQAGPHNGYEYSGWGSARGQLAPVPKSRRWRRWLAAALVVIATWLVVGVGAVKFTERHARRTAPPPPAAAVYPLQLWWLQVRDDFIEVQRASVDVVRAVRLNFPPALEAPCLHLHDAAAVKLRAWLPAPDPVLSAELQAAIEDFHTAAHMCLSVAAGSTSQSYGEFVACLFLAERQMTAVQERIKTTLLRSA